MDFGWSPADDELHRNVLAFARSRLNEGVIERDRAHRFSIEAFRACGEVGLLGLSVPKRWGGMGLSALLTARLVEAFGQGCEDGGLVFSAAAHLFACAMPIAQHGSDALRGRLFPGLANGARIGANAITEAEAGSDVFALRTEARRDGDHYVLSGEKTYVTNGPVADVFLVYATTNRADGYMGVNAFVVEKGQKGLVTGKPFVKMGLTTSPICSVQLDECRVHESARLGAEGAGAAIFTESMRWERACLFASYLGSMERQLESTIAFATSRRQFRKPISKHQAVAHRIVDMKLRLEAARLLAYRGCWQIDQGGDPTLEVSLGKLAVSEAAIQSSLDAIQIHGGAGFMAEMGVERALRDAIPATIFSGTSEIQRELVAKRLGL